MEGLEVLKALPTGLVVRLTASRTVNDIDIVSPTGRYLAEPSA
jgi:hypothetical protein